MSYARTILRFVVLAGSAILAAQQASAADFPKLPIQSAPDSISKPVELGSGWYLRGNIGGSNNLGPLLAPEAPMARHVAWAIDVGAGYKFNNWLRADATLTWNRPRDLNKSGFKVTCPYGLVTHYTNSVAMGYLWDYERDTCSPDNKAELQKTDLMLNAYVDLGSWGGLTPFVGVGAGVSKLKSSSALTYRKTVNGSVYEADLTPVDSTARRWVDEYTGAPITSWVDGAGVVHAGNPPVAFEKQNWNRQATKTSYNLAWSLLGGVAYDIGPQLKTDLTYRYLNSGSYSSLASPLTGEAKSKVRSHQVLLGFRYMID